MNNHKLEFDFSEESSIQNSNLKDQKQRETISLNNNTNETFEEAPIFSCETIITTPNSMQTTQWSFLDLIQGAYLGKLLEQFHKLGVWKDIFATEGNSDFDAEAYAKSRNWDAGLFVLLLDFFCHTSAPFSKVGAHRYRILPELKSYEHFSHVLNKLLGAYSPILDNLGHALSNKQSLGNPWMNLEGLADAFTNQHSTKWLEQLVERHCDLEFSPLIVGDLGCGTATWLINLCHKFERCSGWGLDLSPIMIERGRTKIKESQLSHRIQLFTGDARTPKKHVPESLCKNTTLLVGGSILNEFVRFGPPQCASFLQVLAETFPNATTMILSDYYGKLGVESQIPKDLQHNLLHDVAQALSGQGVPFARKDWVKMYIVAGWQLVDEHSAKGEMDSFVHVIARKQ